MKSPHPLHSSTCFPRRERAHSSEENPETLVLFLEVLFGRSLLLIGLFGVCVRGKSRDRDCECQSKDVDFQWAPIFFRTLCRVNLFRTEFFSSRSCSAAHVEQLTEQGLCSRLCRCRFMKLQRSSLGPLTTARRMLI